MARPIVVVGDLSTEVLDTLRRGETLSELLARQGVLDLDVSRLDAPLLDPRRLRAGLVFSFRRPAAESLPDRISVRASPEQRVVFRRAMNGWGSAVDSIQWRAEPFRIEGDIVNSLYEAIDAQVATTSWTPPSGSGWPGTWPTSTPGRWTSPATSSPATSSAWCSTA